MKKLKIFINLSFWVVIPACYIFFYIKLYTFLAFDRFSLYCLGSQVIKLLFCFQILGSWVRKTFHFISLDHSPYPTTSSPCSNCFFQMVGIFLWFSKYTMLCQVYRNWYRISSYSWAVPNHKYLSLSKISRDVQFINVGEFPCSC